MFGDSEEDASCTVVIIGPHTFSLQVAEDDFNSDKKTLFATMIWHGARALSNYLVHDVPESIAGKTVLEFGAGAGLPSLTCHKIGASITTASDYPAPSLILNLRNNTKNNHNCSCSIKKPESGTSSDIGTMQYYNHLYVIEHIWGEDTSPLQSPLNGGMYDVIIASECLWKSDTHESFATSINNVLKPGGTVHMSFSHHIPGLESVDLSFFEIMKSKNFIVVNIKAVAVQHMWNDGSATVYIYELLKC